MTKQLAILSLAIILLSCKGQYMMKNELSDADIDGIVSLSEDGLPVYLTLTGKQNGQMIKYLLTNIDLYSIFFKGYSFQKEFPKALKKILSNQVKSDVYFSNPELSEYLIDFKAYDQISSSLKTTEIFAKYFDANGVPLYEQYPDYELNVVLAILIDRGIRVHEGKYSKHVVYLIP